MPIYDYHCVYCSLIKYDILVPTEDIHYPACPTCGRIMSRVISKPNFKVNGYSEKNGYSKRE